MKNLADPKALQQRLKEKAAAAAEAERKRRELEREANIFRTSIGDVKPLNTSPRAMHDAPRPLPVAQKRKEDDEAVLQESLSDEFSIDTLLETDEALSFARPGVGPDVLKKLRSGGWVTQGQLDLHGLRVD